MFPQFQGIKDTSVAFRINKIIQICVVMVDRLKSIDAVGTPICCGSADDMVMNPNLDVFSAITRGGWNFRGEKRILLYLNIFKNSLYAVRAFQVA